MVLGSKDDSHIEEDDMHGVRRKKRRSIIMIQIRIGKLKKYKLWTTAQVHVSRKTRERTCKKAQNWIDGVCEQLGEQIAFVSSAFVAACLAALGGFPLCCLAAFLAASLTGLTCVFGACGTIFGGCLGRMAAALSGPHVPGVFVIFQTAISQKWFPPALRGPVNRNPQGLCPSGSGGLITTMTTADMHR